MIIPKNKLQGLKAHFKSEKDPLTDKPIEIKFTFNEFAKVEADFGLFKIAARDLLSKEGQQKNSKIDLSKKY